MKLSIRYSKVPICSDFNRTIWNWNVEDALSTQPRYYILIEPFGIETKNLEQWNNENAYFNRTIWNWNCLVRWVSKRHNLYFNRTIWNWNISERNYFFSVLDFNRTIWNWNRLVSITLILLSHFNRTIWNWNFQTVSQMILMIIILIEPFGIETLIWSRIWARTILF